MKCLVLAAGYATRLYPLTENFPKPLLQIGSKTIIDWLLEDIHTLNVVNEFIVVTNHKFYQHFEKWANAHILPITIIDDGTLSNETRLGAVYDIQYAIDQLHLNDDLLIIAGDNVLDFSLAHFLQYVKGKGTSCTMRYCETNINRLKKSGVGIVDARDRLIALEEKPTEPKSCWCTPPFYFFLSTDIKKINTAIAEGCGTDAPGSLVAWMCKHSIMHSMLMPGNRYDIGNLESYQLAQKNYKGIMR